MELISCFVLARRSRVKWSRKEELLLTRLNRHQPGVGRQIEADGTFHAEVLPGTYEVKATDRSGKASPVVRVEARAHVQGVELTLGRGYEITGRIVVDGPEHPDFSKLILHFFGEPAKIDSAGTFHAIAQ